MECALWSDLAAAALDVSGIRRGGVGASADGWQSAASAIRMMQQQQQVTDFAALLQRIYCRC